MGEFALGQPVSRFEDPRLLRGGGRYVDDIVLPGMAFGFGDLPVPGGFKRRNGVPMYRPPYPALVKDRVRWVGDYVAFVVAETRAQAMDAAELIAVDYEPLPAVVATADAPAPGAPRVWDDCEDNICFVRI